MLDRMLRSGVYLVGIIVFDALPQKRSSRCPIQTIKSVISSLSLESKCLVAQLPPSVSVLTIFGAADHVRP